MQCIGRGEQCAHQTHNKHKKSNKITYCQITNNKASVTKAQAMAFRSERLWGWVWRLLGLCDFVPDKFCNMAFYSVDFGAF